MKRLAIVPLLLLAATAAPAQQKGLRVPGGDPAPHAYRLTDLEIEPPAKRTEGAATAKVTMVALRPSAQLREMEIRLLYADRGFGGSGRFRRDAPQPRTLAAGETRMVAYPATARLGCVDPLQARQIVTVTFDEGGKRMAETHLLPFTWFDRFPEMSGRCHIPTE